MRYIFTLLAGLLLFSGCAYFNTFFNAEKQYREGLEKKQNNPAERKITPEIKRHFQSAIAKSWKVIDSYGDSSRWADDALFMIGRGHFQLEEYDKAQNIFEQFLQKYLQSPFIPEVRLWLGKTYVKLKQDEKALQQLQEILDDTGDEKIRADAHLNLGNLYYLRGSYDLAIENLEQAAELDGSGEIAGNALYRLAEAYTELEQYQNAVDSYERVLRRDLPVLKQYDAIIRMVDALVKLEQYEEAENTLRNILRDQRFKEYYSNIAVKLANLYEFQDDYEYAIDNYFDVIEKYPRSEGAALANFYIAQIYEFEYGWMDSAKVRYDNVAKQNAKVEAARDANNRSKILAEYLKIRDQVRKDKSDIFKLEQGDSTLIDSLVTGLDTVSVNVSEQEQTAFSDTAAAATADSLAFANQDTLQENQTTTRIKEKKVAVSRSPEQVKESLQKNTYRLAEYFLLNYQHYDSATVRYNEFINNFQDSVLTPKAYYALYFIYNSVKNDSITADSLKEYILRQYPDTRYGQKLAGQMQQGEEADDISVYNKYRRAEEQIESEQYSKAIEMFREVAEQDSGTVWAEKARFAIAYVYEHYLQDIKSAVDSYALLAKEYPKSEGARIALKKIAEPKAEEPAAETAPENQQEKKKEFQEPELKVEEKKAENPEEEKEE